MARRRSKQKGSGDRWERGQLAALQRLDLLVDWTPAELERRAEACDADTEATGEDDPRQVDVGWLSEPLYRGLVEQARDRICDEHTSIEDVVALAARHGVVLAPDGGPSREGRHYALIEAGGRVVRTAWASVSRERDLACLAAAVCAAGGAARSCFVRIDRDPRFVGSLYLRIAPAEIDPLVDAEIVIATPDGEVDLISRGLESAATRTWYEVRAVTRGAFAPALVALPLGGRWHIQGQLRPGLPGPVATNVLGTIFGDVYEIDGWRPPEASEVAFLRGSFEQSWAPSPGLAAITLDAAPWDEAQRALRETLRIIKPALAAPPTTISEGWLSDLLTLARRPGLGIAIAVVSSDRAVVASTSGAAVYVTQGGLSTRAQGTIALRPGDRLVLGGRAIETVAPDLGPGALEDPDDPELEEDELAEAPILDASAPSDAVLVVDCVEG